MRKNLLLTALLLIILLGGCAKPAVSPAPSTGPGLSLAQKLQNALDRSRQEANVMGASAAVIMPNEEIWLGVSGMSDPTTGEPIKLGTLFDIGSTGKMYVAVLILQLVEEEKLTLEDPLNKWLRGYPNIDYNITVRQLLNHTSGICDYVKHPRSPFQMAYKSTKIWTQEEILEDLVDKPYFSPPGRGWHYSTTNYILLRMIVEKATQSKVSTELCNRFFNPLHLKNTVPVDPLMPIPGDFDIANNWIRGNVDLAPKPQPWTTTSPHLIYATAGDLAKWSHALFYKRKVLSQTSLDQMLSFHSPAPWDIPISGYGLGIAYFSSQSAAEMFDVKGIRMWGNGGSTLGYRTLVLYLPDHGVSISVLINNDTDEGLGHIFKALLEVTATHVTTNQN
jgi:D-alanyl-D-alanine carboxypeptidase